MARSTKSTKDASTQPATTELPAVSRQTMDGERLLAVFSHLVDPIGRSLPAYSEVVLHDLSLLPNSIVAIYGDVTGRKVGDPATDLLLKSSASSDMDDSVDYETTLPDGRVLRCSTMIIRDVAGNPVAALCINSDVSVWESVAQLSQIMLGKSSQGAAAAVTPPSAVALLESAASGSGEPRPPAEVFVHDVDELAALLLKQAIDEAAVPVELMQKRHKIEVVRSLRARGMFLLRDAVETVAAALSVTRFTIYNYLNEIDSAEAGEHSA